MERVSGILLHPTSLPSRGGIGDLGPAAYEFLDFLVAARQGLWQILPLGPLSQRNSPYCSYSAFAGNPLLISLERLAEAGWIEGSRVAALSGQAGPVDYDHVRATKLPLVREAARNFLQSAPDWAWERFARFGADNGWWLDDYALFVSLRYRHREVSWNQWPRELARREPKALEKARQELAGEMDAVRAVQFAFWEQWRALRQACARRGIRILGDVAIFVDYDSADVWTHPEVFYLNGELEPEFVSGVPPDAFSATGQRWGNPLYRWDVLKARGYDWWVQRMRWAAETCDLVRIDHFRGLEKYWEIAASEETAVHGRWVEGPGDDLFNALRQALGGLPFIAEDLGYITPEVHALRDRLGLPGMKVLQFAFGDPGAHLYLPHRFGTNCAVYPGTHDNDTLLGWWQHGATEMERRHAEAYMGHDPDGINWAFIRTAETSPARYCVIPLQDVLGVGSEGRMNLPSELYGNWNWRYQPEALKPEMAQRLALLAEVSDRMPPPRPQPGVDERFAA
jgi:4-alpha-glucanotransferase